MHSAQELLTRLPALEVEENRARVQISLQSLRVAVRAHLPGPDVTPRNAPRNALTGRRQS